MDLIVLAEIGIVVVAWLLFPNRFAPINLFLLIIGLLSVYAFQPFVSPYISQKQFKETAIQEIENIDLILPIATTIRKVKPSSYEDLVNDIAWNHVKTQNLSPSDRLLSDYTVVLRFFGNFFQAAYDEDIFEYIQAHLKFIRELNQIDSDAVLQFHYPRQFGILSFDTLLKAQSRFKYHMTIARLLESGKYFYMNRPPSNGKHLYAVFFSGFRAKHPEETIVLEAVYTVQTPLHRQSLAKALLMFHSEIASLPPKEASDIWRYMVMNQ